MPPGAGRSRRGPVPSHRRGIQCLNWLARLHALGFQCLDAGFDSLGLPERVGDLEPDEPGACLKGYRRWYSAARTRFGRPSKAAAQVPGLLQRRRL